MNKENIYFINLLKDIPPAKEIVFRAWQNGLIPFKEANEFLATTIKIRVVPKG